MSAHRRGLVDLIKGSLRYKLLTLVLFPILLIMPIFLVLAVVWGSNFSYEQLALTGSTYVRLNDDSDNAAGAGSEAVYVESLVVPAGATLDLAGLNLYVLTSQIDGTVVNGTVTTVAPPPLRLTVGGQTRVAA